MTEPILIDSGPSARGWHRLESFLRCPMVYYWKYVHPARQATDGGEVEPAMPLVRGTIGHVGLAHYYARMKAQREGRDFRLYYSPDAAMEKVAARYKQGPELLVKIAPVVRAYAAHYAAERSSATEILDVEAPVETMFNGWRYTARLDLVTRENGKIWFTDHKFVSKIEDKTLRRYMLSGQFLGQIWLGARTCTGGAAPRYDGEFGGIRINLVSLAGPRFLRVTPEPAPWTLRRFPSIVKTAEEQIVALKDTPMDEWPAAPSELTCYTPYGECEWFDACRWGMIDGVRS